MPLLTARQPVSDPTQLARVQANAFAFLQREMNARDSIIQDSQDRLFEQAKLRTLEGSRLFSITRQQQKDEQAAKQQAFENLIAKTREQRLGEDLQFRQRIFGDEIGLKRTKTFADILNQRADNLRDQTRLDLSLRADAREEKDSAFRDLIRKKFGLADPGTNDPPATPQEFQEPPLPTGGNDPELGPGEILVPGGDLPNTPDPGPAVPPLQGPDPSLLTQPQKELADVRGEIAKIRQLSRDPDLALALADKLGELEAKEERLKQEAAELEAQQRSEQDRDFELSNAQELRLRTSVSKFETKLKAAPEGIRKFFDSEGNFEGQPKVSRRPEDLAQLAYNVREVEEDGKIVERATLTYVDENGIKKTTPARGGNRKYYEDLAELATEAVAAKEALGLVGINVPGNTPEFEDAIQSGAEPVTPVPTTPPPKPNEPKEAGIVGESVSSFLKRMRGNANTR